MLITSALLAAAGLLCWPPATTRHRLPGLPRPPLRLSNPKRLLPLATGLAGWVFAGPAGLCAAMALTLLAGRQLRERRGEQRALALHAEFAEALRLLVTQLRAGAHPAGAAEGAAVEAGPQVAGLFRDLAATARLGGDVSALAGRPRAPVERLTRAWELAERHGVALAELLDSLRRDVERRTAFRREVAAKMAGPRATAGVLTGLPVLGLAFGQAAGASPFAVFGSGPAGQLLLLLGVALLIAGVLWSSRLTRSVVRS
ncbi:type II secretion system F family protein [Saccharopolyspora mangrovi]|uniref:Type II secretion system F family protein n=1 Tax=Saccharopolyspora mangrovi TaxID=3082379 RepID=A0ABU6AD84_9PSEU|nr:type II secretion system F family protein [Saccharopolyspora sp. S2-29]MEB3369437.1 type II secretion system F family protein [Saccharopolyspora sp. S2-29]